MKIFFIAFLLTTTCIFAQTSTGTPGKMKPLDTTPQTEVLPKVAPGASTPALENIRPEPTAGGTTVQKQEQSPGVENKYPIGDYDKNGQYIFFDRLEREKQEADEEAAQQNM